MIKYTNQVLKNYANQLNNINLIDFNWFIIKKILYKFLQIHTLLPLFAAIGVIAFSLSLQDSFYIFIPQSGITSFASYVVFACITSLVVLVFYPLFMIIVINYLTHQLRVIFKHMLLPIKLLILIIIFHIIIETASNVGVTEQLKLYLTFLWTLFYFIIANFYLAYEAKENLFKITRFKFLVLTLFVVLFIKPFLSIFLYTSEMINYTAINPKIQINKQNCQLLTTTINPKIAASNMSINDPNYFESNSDSCLFKGNLVRYGFSSDYVILFKKNINPILGLNGNYYNVYVRLICYYSNSSCYSEDNIIIDTKHDSLAKIIKSNMLHHKNSLSLLSD